MKTVTYLARASILSLYVFTASNFAHGEESRLGTVPESVLSFIHSMSGVSFSGTTGCNPHTGEQSLDSGFVPCLWIGANNEQSTNALKVLFPRKQTFNGVMILVADGPIVVEPYPRVTGGN